MKVVIVRFSIRYGNIDQMLRAWPEIIGRCAVMVVLVLATQLVYAGQVSLAAMRMDTAGMNTGALAAAHNIARANSIVDVVDASQSCCDAGAMNALTCVATMYGVDTAVPAASPINDLPPLASSHFFVALAGASSPRRHLPAVSAGSFPPSYILFRRFLS